MTDPMTIIARCTRCGHVMWQHVANQLGRSVISVRQQYDPSFGDRPAIVCLEVAAPVDEPPPADREISMKSPRLKGDLPLEIIAVLHRRPMTAEMISLRLNRTGNSIRARLYRMLEDKLVQRDQSYPQIWSLTEKGIDAVTRCASQGMTAA